MQSDGGKLVCREKCEAENQAQVAAQTAAWVGMVDYLRAKRS